MDQRDFLAAKEAALRDSGIGTLGEKSVHAVLKAAYEPHGENREDLLRRAVYAPLWERGLFRRLVTIRRGQTGREYVVEELN